MGSSKAHSTLHTRIIIQKSMWKNYHFGSLFVCFSPCHPPPPLPLSYFRPAKPTYEGWKMQKLKRINWGFAARKEKRIKVWQKKWMKPLKCHNPSHPPPSPSSKKKKKKRKEKWPTETLKEKEISVTSTFLNELGHHQFQRKCHLTFFQKAQWFLGRQCK